MKNDSTATPSALISHIPTSFDPKEEPLFDRQWHLPMIGSWALDGYASTAGLERIWEEYTGAGIAVGVWDTGVQQGHWDLEANYDSSRHVVVLGEINDGQPWDDYYVDPHGTNVAGLIAAAANGAGGIGVAYGASITGVRICGGPDDMEAQRGRYVLTLEGLQAFDVTNHSYGYRPFIMSSLHEEVMMFARAAAQGRGGLGTVNVGSAGNDNFDSNGEGRLACRFLLVVGALEQSGFAADYSSYGAHLLVSAPAASMTTDILGESFVDIGLLDGDYTNIFGGTSAASPVTAGVVALMLDANPDLGWRDVHNILAYSSLGTGSLYATGHTNEEHSWKWNGAGNWNGGGLHYSEDYGYGMVNAFTAVRMSEIWSELYPVAGTSATERHASSEMLWPQRSISHREALNYTFFVNDDICLEHVGLTLGLTHENMMDVRIELVAPDGTTMSVYNGSTPDYGVVADGLTYTFGLEGFRGASSRGLWTLRMTDEAEGADGTLDAVKFTGYGSTRSTNEVYHYTDEFLMVVDQDGHDARRILKDTNGGVDWINAAAMHQDVVINLDAAGQSVASGFPLFDIAAGTVIEHVITGDGDDMLSGNAMSNRLYGMRGSDTLTGGAGADSFVFCTPLSVGNVDTITDFRTGVDKIVLDMDVFTRLSGAVGLLSSAYFVASDMAWIPEDTDNYIYFDRVSGALFYDADGSGQGEMTQFAQLMGVKAGRTLSSADFWVVA